MTVYIFPVGVISASTIQDELNKLGITVKCQEDAERRSPSWNETPKSPRNKIVIDPELPFSLNEIAEDFSFGNGVSVGTILLKDGRTIPCAWIVVDPRYEGIVEANLDKIKEVCKRREVIPIPF